MIGHAAAQVYPQSRGHRRPFLLALLVAAFLIGVIGAPVAAPSSVNGDELSDAQAQQKALTQKIAQQKKLIANLNASQAQLAGQISQTKDELAGITNDLVATRKKVTRLVVQVNAVKATYGTLVDQLDQLDAQLKTIVAEEATKKQELGARKAELANRIRQAYEAERTSMLETFLSGASFTDMLTQMSAQLDAADQDRELAQEVSSDRATLLSLHQTVAETRSQTNLLRQETAVQKHNLDLRIGELKKTQEKLKKLERAAKAALAAQKRAYTRMAADKTKLRRAVAATAAAKRRLQHKIDRLVAAQYSQGNIPSQYNGTLRWPMPGSVTQEFGCTGVIWEPPLGSCSHFHQGIDIVAPYGTAVRASGSGSVVYCGWNYADGADPAWIVIVAHSSKLETWYAHMQPSCPVHAGGHVSAGQVIGHEGNTGHSTGAHLHWAVRFNGTFVNPRLFL